MRWSSGDYQIAPIAVRSTAMGRWRLTPPGYGGDTACGRETIPVGDKYYACAAARRRLIRPPAGAPVSLRVGRSADLTRHRRVIQHRGPPGGGYFRLRAGRGALRRCAATPHPPPSGAPSPQGEGLRGAVLLFSAFWWCRSGRSETGVTGRRRGLRRGRRSWENPWHRRP